jgi:hypothetical protein
MDFEKKTREADIIPRLLRHMLKAAWYVLCICFTKPLFNPLYRKHAKVSGEGAPQASNISEAEIEVPKEEWVDLVLSDEE